MSSLHAYYDQLTEENQQTVDRAYRALHDELKTAGLCIEGNDVAERVVDAIARGIIESNQPHLTEPLTDKEWRQAAYQH
jgi:hypothetical protein